MTGPEKKAILGRIVLDTAKYAVANDYEYDGVVTLSAPEPESKKVVKKWAERIYSKLCSGLDVDVDEDVVAGTVDLVASAAGIPRPSLWKAVVSLDGDRANKLQKREVVALVPVANANEHDYPMGKPSIFLGSWENGIRPNGSRGNSLENNASESRPATPEEIYGLTERQIQYLYNNVFLVVSAGQAEEEISSVVTETIIPRRPTMVLK